MLPLWWRGALRIPLSCPNSVAAPAAATSTRAGQTATQGASVGTPSGRWQLQLLCSAFKLTEGSPKAKVVPVGCAVAPPISGQLTIEGIPVLGLVDTGASVTCLGFAIWWRYCAQWGALKQFEGTVHGAHGKPLNIAGRTEHLDIQWGEAWGWASFIVIVGIELPPCLIGMDIMRPLRVHIDVTNGTATPAQPDPQTIRLNAAQRQQPQKRLPEQTASPPPQPQPPTENLASGASLLTEGTAEPSSPQPQWQKIRWLRAGVQLFLPRRPLLQPLLGTSQVLQPPMHHRTWPTLWPCGVVVACLLHTQEVPGSIPGRGSYLRQVSLH